MAMNRRSVVLLIGSLPLLRAATATGQAGPSRGARTVEIRIEDRPGGNGVFAPATITVAPGSTIRWVNKGALLHTVTFDPALAKAPAVIMLPAGVAPFGSDDLAQDESYERKFDVPGTYRYVCRYHQRMGMTGTIIVANR